jgi:type IV pilus assembly protein PilB
MPTLADLLAQSPLFAGLAPLHREQIAPHLTRHAYEPNAEIVRQGDPGDALFVIETGSVGVLRRDPTLGVVQLVATLEPPEAFGEMALLTGEARTATCQALAPVVAHRLSRDVFSALVQQAPGVAVGVARVLAERLGRMTAEREIPWVSLAGRALDRRLWAMAPETAWTRARAVPLDLAGSTLTIGMVDPGEASAHNVIRQAIPGVRVRVCAVGAEDLERWVQAARPAAQPAQRGAAVSLAPEARPKVSFLEDDESRGPARPSIAAAPTGPQVVALVDELVGTGLGAGASDIHVEPERRGLAVRYRIEGELRPRPQLLPAEIAKPLVSRLKLLSRLDITDTRRPQDGRMSVQVDKRLVDLRVSTMPTKFGEKVVMRILDAEANVVDLKAIILQDKVRQFFSEMVFRPHGLVLVTGPTGSGKTTTMYSALMARRRPELNVVTVEDPIEYHLDGTTQIQVQPEVGTTFGTVLRALLRQDPDVIMVGETRDAETARMAVEASMTGHLVLTSLHTNGSLESVLRLTDLGVEPYAVANSLLGVLHQRLVRRCCAGCAEPYEYPAPIVERMYRVGAFLANERPALVRGKGCARCGGTGFKGRVAVLELLVVSDPVRQAIGAGADMAKLREAAKAGSLVELARYAGILVGTGVTVPGEVLHMLQSVGA